MTTLTQHGKYINDQSRMQGNIDNQGDTAYDTHWDKIRKEELEAEEADEN